METITETKFVQSEVGLIPAGWECNKLENYVSFISYGFTNPMPTVDYGVYMITANDINDGRIKLETARRTSEKAYKNLLTDKSRPKQNDILLTKDGTLGRLAIVSDETICINQSVAVIRPNDKVFPPFLKMLLEDSYYQKTMIGDAGGSTIKHIYISVIGKMNIALPSSKTEQIAIATVLNDADVLIAQLEKLIAKKRVIKQGAMQELLTGKRRLPGFQQKNGYNQTEIGTIPRDWEIKTINEISEVKSGKRLPLGKSLLDKETPHPYIRVADMFMGGVSQKGIKYVPADVYPSIKNYRIFSNDIFISVAGTLGIVGKIPKRLNGANLTENADRLTNIACNNDYLLYSLMSSLIQNKIEAEKTLGAQPKLALTRIKTFLVPLPPTKAEQIAIVEILNDMDAETGALEKKLHKYIMLKEGMMQNLLTGRIRLI